MTHRLKEEVVCLTFHPYKPWLAVATITNLASSLDSSVTSVKIWDISPGLRRAVEGDLQALSASGDKAGYRCVGEITCAGTVSKIAFAPDGRLLGIANHVTDNQLATSITSKQTDRVILYLASEGFNAVKTDIFPKSMSKNFVHSKRITCLAFCPDPIRNQSRRTTEEGSRGLFEQCELVASGDADGNLRLWDFYNDETWHESFRNGVQEIAFSPDGRLLLCLLRSGSLEGYTIDHSQSTHASEREEERKVAESAKDRREGKRFSRVSFELHAPARYARRNKRLSYIKNQKIDSKRPKLLKFVAWRGLGDLLCFCFMPVTPPSTCLRASEALEILESIPKETKEGETFESPVISLVGPKDGDTSSFLPSVARINNEQTERRGSFLHRSVSPPEMFLQRALSDPHLDLMGDRQPGAFFKRSPKLTSYRHIARTPPPVPVAVAFTEPSLPTQLSSPTLDHKHALRKVPAERATSEPIRMSTGIQPLPPLIPTTSVKKITKDTAKERLIMEASKHHLWSWRDDDALQDPDIVLDSDLPTYSDDEDGGGVYDDDDIADIPMKGKRQYQIAVGGKGKLRVFQFEIDDEYHRNPSRKIPSPKEDSFPDEKSTAESLRMEKEIGCWMEFGAFDCSSVIECIGSYWNSPTLIFGESEETSTGSLHRLRMWSPVAPQADRVVGIHSERIATLDLPKLAMMKDLQMGVISAEESFFASASMGTFRLWIRSESKYINQHRQKDVRVMETHTSRTSASSLPLFIPPTQEDKKYESDEEDEEEIEKPEEVEDVDYSDQNHLEDFGKLARSVGTRRECECVIL